MGESCDDKYCYSAIVLLLTRGVDAAWSRGTLCVALSLQGLLGTTDSPVLQEEDKSCLQLLPAQE